jgi:hypothetical protein
MGVLIEKRCKYLYLIKKSREEIKHYTHNNYAIKRIL